ncbi:hypothetical protein A2291_02035 [candidate division WOR-1 bacterium RIFOXYB2_FULL_42_35]|uniref:Uncharacterized protein n=1 Tax=candidate division WOR-1 bacterium RIFOXYC2_FULL_41_25 TaxID=1802586 RepID=A0A1F4TPY3_UNCSA|nr:MAG: hypothetical protein A2247_03835 [candidate division WOR-1 bacterium RIFOXYA2_FULL_41_14]OGC25182.1 MAG: hypothetical protein A2291_02035 [candidate division WOR-1 bacterium RIFOXYB2_FULL_42_35]OGC34738.1 MAG: hypothetical protein A2462_03350 [candidate division WOR-1 bacterium RIFOXYC2_FULL_41_25]OGC42693.1 MAG: hypothetical protein A2548_03250 [candidate division WOR-1 bacterium RIFOXYD2_FULL_41_8]
MKKLHYFTAICSALVVGLGQIIEGESKKGLLLLLVFYFALPALTYLALLTGGSLPLYIWGLTIVAGLIIWTYSVGEALFKS